LPQCCVERLRLSRKLHVGFAARPPLFLAKDMADLYFHEAAEPHEADNPDRERPSLSAQHCGEAARGSILLFLCSSGPQIDRLLREIYFFPETISRRAWAEVVTGASSTSSTLP